MSMLHLPSRSLFVIFNVMLVGLAGIACNSSGRRAGQTEAPDNGRAFSISIDQDNNRAAVSEAGESLTKPQPLPRTLAFEMAGIAGLPDATASQEQRAAATQAAIIDAFCRALIEARRARGQTDSNFTAELGPNLTVTHRSLEAGYEVRVSLSDAGIQKEFVIRDGVLQHSPLELRLVQRLFEETGGEFSLLGTEWQPARGECIATVGCYLPEGYDTKVAFDEVDGKTTEMEAVP